MIEMFFKKKAIEYDEKKKKIFQNYRKDPYDPKKYRGIILDNGLVVLLISYPPATKSAVFLTVDVGSSADPEKLQGLAHLLEHMIFCGNEKYPDPNELYDLILKFGFHLFGSTYPDKTFYTLEIDSKLLEKTLDVFANLFINPLFDPVKLEDQSRKIHDEYLDRIQSEDSIIHFIEKETCDQTHEFHKIGCGNMETLNYNPKSEGIDVRERLFEFFSENYSSHIMSLCVFGKEDLDELQEMVCERVPFNKIEKRDVKQKLSSRNPFKRQHLMKEIKIVPNDDREELIMDFKMPKNFFENQNYETFYAYLSRLMSYFDEDGLSYVLQSKGWIDSSKVDDTKIHFDLTEKGFDNIDEIVSVVFQYINLLKKEGLQQWVLDELNKLKQLKRDSKESRKFYHIDPKISVEKFPHQRHSDFIKDIIENPENEKFDFSDKEKFSSLKPDDLNFYLNQLDTANLRIYIKSKKFTGITDRVEKHHSTKYKIEDIRKARITRWDKVRPNPDLKLPKPNQLLDYLPISLDLANELRSMKLKYWELVESDKFDHPKLKGQFDFTNYWFLKKNVFNTYKSFYGISIKNPTLCEDLVSYGCMSLYVFFMIESMKMFMNQAIWAGYEVEIALDDGLFIEIIGRSEKLELILSKIIETLVRPFDQLNRNDFERAKRRFLAYIKEPQNLGSLIREKFNTLFQILKPADFKRKILDHVDELTLENVDKIRKEFFSRIKIQIFAFGNVEIVELNLIKKKFITPLIESYNSISAINSSFPRIKIRKLESNSFTILKESSPRHEMNVIFNYYEFGIANSIDELVRIKLLVKLIEFEFFYLFPYVKQIRSILLANVVGLEILIQHSFEVDYLDDCIEKFLISSEVYLEKLNDEDFEQGKERLRIDSVYWRQSMSPKEKFKRLWKYINSVDEKWNFDIKGTTEAFLAALEKITKQDIINLFNENLFEKKRKLSIRIIGMKEESIKGPKLANSDRFKVQEKLRNRGVLQRGDQIIDIDEYRESLEFYPENKTFNILSDIVGFGCDGIK